MQDAIPPPSAVFFCIHFWSFANRRSDQAEHFEFSYLWKTIRRLKRSTSTPVLNWVGNTQKRCYVTCVNDNSPNGSPLRLWTLCFVHLWPKYWQKKRRKANNSQAYMTLMFFWFQSSKKADSNQLDGGISWICFTLKEWTGLFLGIKAMIPFYCKSYCFHSKWTT